MVVRLAAEVVGDFERAADQSRGELTVGPPVGRREEAGQDRVLRGYLLDERRLLFGGGLAGRGDAGRLALRAPRVGRAVAGVDRVGVVGRGATGGVAPGRPG